MFNRKFVLQILILSLVLNLVFPIKEVFANDDHRLDSIEISVYVNNDGSARIREKRESYLTEGTENYIVMGNLADSEIIDFQVTEDGELYEYVDNWNIDASRESKAYKNGIIETSNGYELSWGIGEYGSHNYELEYTISNFVKQFEDAQGIFWRFINDQTNTPPKNAKVIIEGDLDFVEDNSKIWSFGHEGEINFKDGKIVATSRSAFDRSDYLTILVKLEDGMIGTTSAMINQPFEEIKDQAFEGSDYGSDSGGKSGPFGIGKGDTPLGKMIYGLINIVTFIPMLTIFLMIYLFGRKKGSKTRKFKREFKGEYYRDYPYEGDFEDAYYILQDMGVSETEDLMTGFILKWIHKEYIIVDKLEAGLVFKKEETALRFIKKDMESETVEGSLYNMMLEAAGSNEILESNEFTKWAKRHYKRLERWEKKAEGDSSQALQELDYIDLEEKRILFFKTHDLSITEKGEALEERVHKFINYLYDFSLLNEHEAVNVGIWDNLMIWAGILGITEVVSKEFEKIYPDYQVESVYRGNSIYMAHAFSRSASRAAASRAAQQRRSSGGGGFSSSGGGGGSFGGGSGGGTR